MQPTTGESTPMLPGIRHACSHLKPCLQLAPAMPIHHSIAQALLGSLGCIIEGPRSLRRTSRTSCLEQHGAIIAHHMVKALQSLGLEGTCPWVQADLSPPPQPPAPSAPSPIADVPAASPGAAMHTCTCASEHIPRQCAALTEPEPLRSKALPC